MAGSRQVEITRYVKPVGNLVIQRPRIGATVADCFRVVVGNFFPFRLTHVKVKRLSLPRLPIYPGQGNVARGIITGFNAGGL